MKRMANTTRLPPDTLAKLRTAATLGRDPAAVRARIETSMFGNVGVDFALGLIPFIGAVPDFFFRSNSRNLRIVKRHLDKHFPAGATIDARR